MTRSAQSVQEVSGASRRLRVAVVSETFAPEVNGVAMTLGRLVDGLRQSHYPVQLIRPRQNCAEVPVSTPLLEELLAPGMPIPGYAGLRVGLPSVSAISRLWTTRRPDVVHIATEGPLGWSALNAAKKLRLPIVSGFHTNFHRYSCHYRIGFLKRPIMAYLRRFHNATLATMVPTASLQQELSDQGFRGLRVVARGVDTRLFDPARRDRMLRAKWGVADNDLAVLYVGRLAPEKNLALVARAFEAMRGTNAAIRLIWVGDGPERAALARRFPQHVFAGSRSGEDLAAHYASADIFLFPSMTETFGNVTLEAMASGLAVLAYDYAAARQHIVPGSNGLLAPFGDAEAFTREACRLAGDARRIDLLGRRARDATRSLDWCQVVDDYRSVLLDAVANRLSTDG